MAGGAQALGRVDGGVALLRGDGADGVASRAM